MYIASRAAASGAEVKDVDPSDQFRNHRLPSPCTSDHLVAKNDVCVRDAYNCLCELTLQALARADSVFP